MKCIKTVVFLLLSLQIISVSCTKKEDNKCVAGNGGVVTLAVYPKHHGKSVKPTNAYIKYNSKDAPSSMSEYDLTIVADTTLVSMKLANLKCGDYYIFATGYDTGISKAVKGGIPFTIAENASGEINVDIPVTE